MKQVKVKIISNKKVAADHYELFFKAPATLTKTKPGQFFNIRISDSYEPFLRRPFGFFKSGKNRAAIFYKVVGKATRVLSAKKEGDTIDVLGPLGNGFEIPAKKPKKAILVAGGHGVAPLYALCKELHRKRINTTVLIGSRTKSHVVCEKDFKNLGVKVRVATEDGTKGKKGLVTDLLLKELKNIKPKTIIYACGPKPMLKAVAKISLKERAACDLSLEEYMACGTGTCLGCAVKTRSGYRMVCKDGPVFNAGDLVWQD